MKEKAPLLDKTIYHLFEITPVPTVLSLPNGKLEYVNLALKKMLGYEGNDIYHEDVTITHPGDIKTNKTIRDTLTKNPFTPIQIEKRYIHKLGHTIYAQLNIVAQPNDKNKIKRYISQLIDLSAIKKSDAAEILLNHLVNHSNDAIYVVDPKFGQILNGNELAYQRLGYTKEELLLLSVIHIQPGFKNDNKWEQHYQRIKRNGNLIIESAHTRKDGSQFPIEASISVVEYKKTNYLIAIVRDITRRKEKELEALALANLDPLTKLPNRRVLETKLKDMLIKANKKNTLVAFIYIDLDNFKLINDSHGHTIGDGILVGAANRLRHCVRKSDVVARMGGDEFLVVMNGVDNKASLKIMTSKLKDEFSLPFKIKSHLINVEASIGVSVFSNNNADAYTLIQLADEAMYEAKKQAGTTLYYI